MFANLLSQILACRRQQAIVEETSSDYQSRDSAETISLLCAACFELIATNPGTLVPLDMVR